MAAKWQPKVTVIRTPSVVSIAETRSRRRIRSTSSPSDLTIRLCKLASRLWVDGHEKSAEVNNFS